MVLPVEEGQADDEHHEAGRERDDVIDSQVAGRMGVARRRGTSFRADHAMPGALAH